MRKLIVPVLAAAGWAAYQNSFQGAFVFDDFAHVVDNPHIRHLWPPWDLLSSTARPLVGLSLALNYAVGGLKTWGYHLFNLTVHLLAALFLFGALRRTFLLPCFQERYRSAAPWLAGAIALLWEVHPLQTESVTYLIQRAEALMGLFFFLTLYCVIRREDAVHPNRWRIAAVLSCALGMASKPTMALAPLAVLGYERVFFRRPVSEILRREKYLYLGLAATWMELALLLTTAAQEYAASAGFAWKGASPWRYALTQPDVILHYLKLVFWPHPLVLDYHGPMAGMRGAAGAPALLIVAGAGLLTFWALLRRRKVGFLGLWFFLTLAPASSVIPLADTAAEHRMYLPLAAVAAGVVLWGYETLFRIRPSSRFFQRAVAAALIGVGAAALGTATRRRNRDYSSEISIWADTAAKRPDNFRAHNNLGKALEEAGRMGEAEAHYRQALRLEPNDAAAYQNLGNLFLEKQQWEEAFSHLAEAVRLDPKSASALNDYGTALFRQGRGEEAASWLEKAAALDPNHAEAHSNLGLLLFQQGRRQEALDHCLLAVRLKPDYAAGHNNWGVVLFGLGRVEEAAGRFREAVRLAPDNLQFRQNLSTALSASETSSKKKRQMNNL